MWEWRSPLDVAELDQLRQLAFARRLQLAAALAQLRLDVVVAEALVDLLLGLAGLDLAALGLGDPVLGDREAAGDRLFAQLHVVGLGAGEVLEQVAEGGGRDDPQVDRDRRCGSGRGRRWGRGCRRRRSAGGRRGARRAPPAPRRWRSGRCPCRSRPSGGPSRRPRPGWRPGARAAPPPAPRRSAAPSRAAAGPAPRPARRAAPARRGCSPRPSARGPLTSRILFALGRRFEVLHRGDVELLEEAPRGFRPTPGTRVTSIRVGGNFAFSFTAAGISPVASSASIFSASVLPTPGTSVARPCAGQLGDRDRALADRLGGGAVGEHAVFDRAVELVEDAQLFQRGGDLGVGHGSNLPGRRGFFRSRLSSGIASRR